MESERKFQRSKLEKKRWDIAEFIELTNELIEKMNTLKLCKGFAEVFRLHSKGMKTLKDFGAFQVNMPTTMGTMNAAFSLKPSKRLLKLLIALRAFERDRKAIIKVNGKHKYIPPKGLDKVEKVSPKFKLGQT